MDIICDKDKCTGCGLCVFGCPKQCINMKSEGALGHLFPEIDKSRCIDCGLCQKKCPVLNGQKYKSPAAAYAAWSKNDYDYQSSTSGGAASVLSQYVIDHGGAVYGCAMLPDLEVKHIRVDKTEDLIKLKGSKYVQSNAVEVYPLIKEDLAEGRLTLFIGTPCQVAAVKNMFKTQPEKLILVDLICHGVPSLTLLKQHIKNVADYPHYDSVVFRDGTYVIIIVVDGKEVYRRHLNRPRFKDFYINSFFDGFTFRESCYQCPYARPERISDITIGDFWGLGKNTSADSIPEHRYGCSLIMPSTDVGLKMVEAISVRLHIYERTVEEAVNGNKQLQASVRKNVRISTFRKLFPYIGFIAYRIAIFDKYIWYILKRSFKEVIRRK